MIYLIRGAGVSVAVDVTEQEGGYRVRVAAEGEQGKEYDVWWSAALGRSHRTLGWDGGRYRVVVEPEGDALGVTVGIDHFDFQVETVRSLPARPGGRQTSGSTVEIRAPMPGLIVSVEGEIGRPVAAGQTVAVIEAMKMQMELRAPSAGILRRLGVTPGREVAAGDLVAVLHTDDAGMGL